MCSFLEMPDAAMWSPRPRTTPSLTLVQGFNATLRPYPAALAAAVSVIWGFNPARRCDTDCTCQNVAHTMLIRKPVFWDVIVASVYQSIQRHSPRNQTLTRQLRTNIANNWYCLQAGRLAQSVQRLAMGWAVRESNPGGGRDFTKLSRLALEPTQPPVEWAPGLSRRQRAAVLMLITRKMYTTVHLLKPVVTPWLKTFIVIVYY